MIRLGLIGCGEHSEIGHAIPLARYKGAHPDEIELTAACDIRLERAQEFCTKYGFQRAYREVDEMLRGDKLDACIMVVQPERISALGIELLKTGIPCVVEKPLGSTLAEVKSLCDAAAATDTPNMVSVNRRFMPFLNRALEWTRSAGPIEYVHCTMARHARAEPEFIWATAVHAVDTARYISGDVAESEIRRLNFNSPATVWCAIDLVFQNRSCGRIDVVPTGGMVEETYDLFGEDFRVTITCPFGPQRGWRAFRRGVVVREEVTRPEMAEDEVFGFYDEASALIHALNSGNKLQPTIVDVGPSVELCMSLAEKLKSTD
jgi:predicted dehydrogenase